MNESKITARISERGLPEWLLPHVAEVRGWGRIDSEDTNCWVDACERDAYRAGLCKSHFKRAGRAWHPSPSEAGRARKTTPEPPSRL